MALHFFLNIPPPTATHQMKKVAVVRGKPRVYEPEAVVRARRLFEAALLPLRPQAPLEGPLYLSVALHYPMTKKMKKVCYKTTRPDIDNSLKLLLDSMTKTGYWQDDSQVVSLAAAKYYSDTPGIWIFLRKQDEYIPEGPEPVKEDT